MKTTTVLLLGAVLLVGAADVGRAGVGFGVIEESEEVKHARLKERAERYFKDGTRALAEGDTSRGVRMLLWVAKMRIDSPYPQQAFEELKKITQTAARELEMAREFLAGEAPEAGLKELARIKRTYPGLYVAKQAGRLLGDLEKDPKFQQMLRAQTLAEDLERARALEVEAEALAATGPDAEPAVIETASEEGETDVVDVAALTSEQRREVRVAKLKEAWELYERVVRLGVSTEPGQAAVKALKRLAKDEALADQIEAARCEEKARGWLSLASNYYRAGRMDLAKDYCRKILAECPRTPQAEPAKAMLESITK